MKLSKSVTVGIWLLFGVILPCEASSQRSDASNICSSKWFEEQAAAAFKEDKAFLLLTDALFEQGDYAYAVTVRVPRSYEGFGVTLLIFAKKGDATAYRKIYEEEVPTELLVLGMMMEERSPRCVFPHYNPWLDASVVDLDGDGRSELIVESNEIGTCSSCLSTVRVYKIQGDRVDKVVEELFNAIRFGPGKGLVLESFVMGVNGELLPVKKQFFVVSDQ